MAQGLCIFLFIWAGGLIFIWSQTMTMSRAIIIGRLGRDPEFKITGNNLEVATFSMCTDHRKVDGTKEANWHQVKTFGKQANFSQKYLKRGDQCCVEGRLETRTYEKDGVRRTAQSIVAEKVTILSSARKKSVPEKEVETVAEAVSSGCESDVVLV
jgi:single-strand DNA-binding protein